MAAVSSTSGGLGPAIERPTLHGNATSWLGLYGETFCDTIAVAAGVTPLSLSVDLTGVDRGYQDPRSGEIIRFHGPEVIARRLDRTPLLSHTPWGRLVVRRHLGPEMTSEDTSTLISSLRRSDVLAGGAIGSHRRGNDLWISLDGWKATQDVALAAWLADHPELEDRIVLEAT